MIFKLNFSTTGLFSEKKNAKVGFSKKKKKSPDHPACRRGVFSDLRHTIGDLIILPCLDTIYWQSPWLGRWSSLWWRTQWQQRGGRSRATAYDWWPCGWRGRLADEMYDGAPIARASQPWVGATLWAVAAPFLARGDRYKSRFKSAPAGGS